MESCYHPVLEIQWSCENPPTDFLKAFVILQILLRKFYSDNRIFPFQTTCFIFLPLALSFFDKVGSLFLKALPPFSVSQVPRIITISIVFFPSVCHICLPGPFGKNHHLFGLLFRLLPVLRVSGIRHYPLLLYGCFSPSALLHSGCFRSFHFHANTVPNGITACGYTRCYLL